MSIIFSLVSSHLLTILEHELVNAEPKLVAMIIQEIELLISKLENLLSSKAPKAAAIANPVLVGVGAAAVSAVQAAGDAAVASVNNNS